jgi:glutathione S-transferase
MIVVAETEATMKLYDSQHAPNPRRVKIFLAEKGIDIEPVQLDLGTGENLRPEFLAKNPMGRVPVLELDDGTCIAESVAICRYFEELHPDPPLMGTDAVDRAIVEMWNRRMELGVFAPCSYSFRHLHPFFADRYPQIAEWGEESKKNALEQLAWLDGDLADREFIAGDRFTIADITALTGIDFGRVSKIRIQDDQVNLKRWYESVTSRPSAKA